MSMVVEKQTDSNRPSIRNLVVFKRDGSASVRPSDVLRSKEGHEAYENMKQTFGWGEKYKIRDIIHADIHRN